MTQILYPLRVKNIVWLGASPYQDVLGRETLKKLKDILSHPCVITPLYFAEKKKGQAKRRSDCIPDFPLDPNFEKISVKITQPTILSIQGKGVSCKIDALKAFIQGSKADLVVCRPAEQGSWLFKPSFEVELCRDSEIPVIFVPSLPKVKQLRSRPPKNKILLPVVDLKKAKRSFQAILNLAKVTQHDLTILVRTPFVWDGITSDAGLSEMILFSRHSLFERSKNQRLFFEWKATAKQSGIGLQIIEDDRKMPLHELVVELQEGCDADIVLLAHDFIDSFFLENPFRKLLNRLGTPVLVPPRKKWLRQLQKAEPPAESFVQNWRSISV